MRSQKSSAARSRRAPASGREDLMPVLDAQNTPSRHRPGFAPDAMLSHAVQHATIEIDEERSRDRGLSRCRTPRRSSRAIPWHRPPGL